MDYSLNQKCYTAFKPFFKELVLFYTPNCSVVNTILIFNFSQNCLIAIKLSGFFSPGFGIATETPSPLRGSRSIRAKRRKSQPKGCGYLQDTYLISHRLVKPFYRLYPFQEDNPILSATSACDKPDFIPIFFKSSAISLVKTNIEKD